MRTSLLLLASLLFCLPVFAHMAPQTANDAGVSGFSALSASMCGMSATQPIQVTVANVGTAAQTGIPVYYRLNGTTYGPETVPGTLAAGSSTAFTFAQTANMSAPGTYTLKAWAALPGDGDATNDTTTLVINHLSGMGGSYTINSSVAASATNYVSFGAAVSDLTLKGVCGPATLNVLNGPYNEQVTLGAVTGASSTNTITFEGGTGVKPTLTFGATTTTDRQVLKLNGAAWVRVRNLRIENTNSAASGSWGVGVHLVNGANNNIIENCKIVVDSVQSVANNYVGVMISGVSGTVTPTSAGYNPNNTVRNNEIRGGYFGIAVTGGTSPNFNTGIVLQGNDLYKAYFAGIRIANSQAPLVDQNDIYLRPSTATAAYGIFATAVAGGTFSRNKVIEARFAGLFFTTINATANVTPSPVTIVNNFVSCDYSLASDQNGAIYLTGTVNDTRVWNNSAYATGTIANAMRNHAGTTSTGIDIRNNSLMTEATTGFALIVTNLSSLTKLDFNNYHAPQAPNLIQLGSTFYSAVTMPGANGYNAHSNAGDPGYLLAPNNLHTVSAQLWNEGTDSLGVVIDYDGDVRPQGSNPGIDIGADEFTPATKDIGVVSVLSPASGCGLSGAEDIAVSLTNFGNDTIFSFTLAYSLNGAATVTTPISDTLAPGAIIQTLLSSVLNLSTPGMYELFLTATLPTDANPLNDTTSITVYSLPNISTFPYNQSFDAGFSGWMPGGALSSWELGTPAKNGFNAAASAPNCWATNLNGLYNHNEKSWVISPCFNFSSLVQPVVELDVWWDCETSYDGMVLQSSTDGGVSWQNVGAFGDPNNWYNDNSISGLGGMGGNLSGWSGLNASSSGGWRTARHALTGLGGQTDVRLRVAFGSNSSLNNYSGVAFDNVFLYETPGNDVGATRFFGPDNGCGDSASAVLVEIKNYGLAAQSNFPVTVHYALAGGSSGMLSAVYAGPLAPGAVDTVLVGTLNTTAGGAYTFNAATGLAGDPAVWNDSAWFGPVTFGAIPASPAATDVYQCLPGTMNLVATGAPGTIFRWYDAPVGGALLAENDTLTQHITGNTTFYAEARQLVQTGLGLPDPLAAGGSSSSTVVLANAGLSFSVIDSIIIDSVTVYPATAGNLELVVRDGGGVPVITVLRAVAPASANAPVVVPVGISLGAGTNLSLVAGSNTTCGGLMRTTSLVNFPFSDYLGQCTITGGTPNTFYNFFYDWKITVLGCASPRTLVTAGIYPAPQVSLGADQFICDSAVLAVSGFPTVVFNDTLFANSLTVKASGAYRVTVADLNGCTASDTVVIQQNPIPVVNLGPDTAACAPVVLDGGGQPGDAYVWTTPSGPQFSPTTTAVVSGQYGLQLTNVWGCTDTGTVQVSIVAPPVVNIGAGITDTVCTGATLDAGNAGAAYAWSTPTGGATTQTIPVAANGKYAVVVTNSIGCTAKDSVTLVVNAAPSQPTGIFIGYTGQPGEYILSPMAPISGVGNIYTWTITSATGVVQTFTGETVTVTLSGVDMYQVELSVSNPCGTALPYSDVIFVGVEKEALPLSLFPNPSSGVVQVVSPFAAASLHVYDAQGREVRSASLLPGATQFVDLSTEGAGVYLFRVSDGEREAVRRVVVH